LGHVAEWVEWLESCPFGLARGKRAERLAWVGWRVFAESARMLERSLRSNRGERNAEGCPVPAGRIRRSWEAGECVAVGPVAELEEVASGEWRVTSDNSRAFGRAEVEAGVIPAFGVRERGRAGSGSCSCL